MSYFKRLLAPTEHELLQIQSIYEPNFPASERKPFEMLVQGVGESKNHLFVLQEGQIIRGMAVLSPLAALSMMFLEYIAIDPSRQNLGMGSKLFQNIAFYYSKLEDIKAIIWEVEPPEPADPSAIVNRRIKWYERLGAAIIPMTEVYVMPSYRPEDSVPVSLRLMWHRIDNPSLPITVEEIQRIIQNIYQTTYPDNMMLYDQIIGELWKRYSG